MTTNTDISVKTFHVAPAICFLILSAVWGAAFCIPESLFLTLPLLVGCAALFFLYYLASEGHLKGIVGGIITSLVLMGIAALIPLVGWLILLVWIFYNVAKAIESVRSLLPDAILCLMLTTSLVIPVFYRLNTYNGVDPLLSVICGAVYFIAAIVCCIRINKNSSNDKHALFLFSLTLLSVPLIMLLLISIVSSLRAAFRTLTVSTTSIVKGPQQVSGYVRQDGTLVKEYTRSVSKTVIASTTTISPGTGAIGASLVGNLGSANTAAMQNDKGATFMLEGQDRYATNAQHHLYRHDDLDNKKVGSFILAINKAEMLPPLRREEIIFYFDETLLGKGDNGVVLTNEALYCLPGSFEKDFYTLFSNVEKVIFKGLLNKHIVLKLKNSQEYSITLTQSNEGARKLAEIIHKFI